jgi:ElaB/YqjD/DUF883 family membrane-anchored ribosome-binding protein
MNLESNKSEAENKKLREAIKDLLEYVEDFGTDDNGKLTRQAKQAIRKSKAILK